MKKKHTPKYFDTPENRAMILDICASTCGITREVMLSKTRERKIVIGRSIAAKILRERMCLPLRVVGAILGPPNAPKDHSTVLHMVSVVDDLLFIKDDDMTFLWDIVNFKLENAMKRVAMVVVSIPDGDEGKLLKYLTDQDYRHEVIE